MNTLQGWYTSTSGYKTIAGAALVVIATGLTGLCGYLGLCLIPTDLIEVVLKAGLALSTIGLGDKVRKAV